jgi:hypothetical protein
MLEAITGILSQHPCLRRFLEKVCHRYDRQGELAGVMKLGKGLAEEELAALTAFFGLRALTLTQGGEVKVNWSRFFEGRSASEVEAWIDGLYQGLGRAREDRRQKQESEIRTATLLLDRLRLAYPELNGIHHHLRETLPALVRQIGRQGEKMVADRAFQAAEIIQFLIRNQESLTFSELGARFVNDSKALRDTELSRLVASWLQIQEETEEVSWSGPADTIWERYHVVRDRLAVQATLFGPLLYTKAGRTHDWILRLWEMGEPATLSWANISGMDRIRPAPGHEDGQGLITIENETPFTRLIRERHPATLLYTEGFPNDAVLALYRLLALDHRRHWGDSDLAGLRIAAILNAIRALRLWRCDLATLKRHDQQMIPLNENQAEQLTNFLKKHPEFPFIPELAFTLAHGWLEQESWQP